MRSRPIRHGWRLPNPTQLVLPCGKARDTLKTSCAPWSKLAKDDRGPPPTHTQNQPSPPLPHTHKELDPQSALKAAHSDHRSTYRPPHTTSLQKVPKGNALASIFPVQNDLLFTERDVVYHKSKQTALNVCLNGSKRHSYYGAVAPVRNTPTPLFQQGGHAASLKIKLYLITR